MSLRPLDVPELYEGDVVRVRKVNWPEWVSVTGPVYYPRGLPDRQPYVGGCPIRTMAVCGTLAEFELIEKALRPMYVNHPRTEPMPGDVVRDADDDASTRVWIYGPHGGADARPWMGSLNGYVEFISIDSDRFPKRALLLVDGETGMAVTAA
jgi:hypothetical protein